MTQKQEIEGLVKPLCDNLSRIFCDNKNDLYHQTIYRIDDELNVQIIIDTTDVTIHSTSDKNLMIELDKHKNLMSKPCSYEYICGASVIDNTLIGVDIRLRVSSIKTYGTFHSNIHRFFTNSYKNDDYGLIKLSNTITRLRNSKS